MITKGRETKGNCKLLAVRDSLLEPRCPNSVNRISLDSISILFRQTESRPWRGTALGLFGGAVVGGVFGAVSYRKPAPALIVIDIDRGGYGTGGAIVGGGIGFLVGEVAAEASGGDKIYNLHEIDHAGRVALIRSLINGDK